MVEKLRKELHECIDQYDLLSPKTIAKSQELDIEIVKRMKEINSSYIEKQSY